MSSISSLGSRLKQSRDAAALTQLQLAQLLDVSRSLINALESDMRGNRPDVSLMMRMANVLQVSDFWLLTGEGSAAENGQLEKVKMIPIIAWDDVAKWKKDSKMLSLRQYSNKDVVHIAQPCPNNCFALTIKDNSMISDIVEGDIFKPDDIVIIDADAKPKKDSYVVASVTQNSEPIVRKMFETAGGFALKPLNTTQYQTHQVTEETVIHGVVIARMNAIQRFN